MGISWLFEGAMSNQLTYPYIAPNRVQAKNIAWDDHVARLLTEFRKKGVPYKTNETELSVTIGGAGKVQLFGVENQEALRGISNWGRAVCVAKGTMIATADGDRRVEDIRRGDYVLTPNGLRRVLNSGQTGVVRELVKVRLSTGEEIVCTPDHKVFSLNGVVSCDELRYNDVVWTQQYLRLLRSRGLCIGYTKERGITVPGLGERPGIYIGKYGKASTGKSQMVVSSIIKMVTGSTTRLKTWCVSLLASTQSPIPNTAIAQTQARSGECYQRTRKGLLRGLGLIKVKSNQERTSKRLKKQPEDGTAPRKAKSGTLRGERKTGGIGRQLARFVRSVAKSIWPIIPKGLDTAPRVVEIRSLSVPEGQPVYNLTVNIDHCYYANGVLVKNCDEYDDWEEDIWPTIIRPNLMVHQAPAIVMGTPKGFRGMYKLEANPDFKAFHFASDTNPDLPKAELESMIEEYKKLGEDYYRQEIVAEYVKPVGVVYREWNMDRQYIPLSYDPHLPLHVTFDWGVNDPTAVIWIQPHGSETRVIDYYEASDANIEHFVSVINAKPYKKPDLFTGDPAGKARTLTTGTSVIEMLAEKGIHVRTKDGVKIPDQIRIAHDKMPGLYVAKPQAEGFRDCLLNYRYPKKSTGLVNQENEIPIHDRWSHGMRAFEYWAVNVKDGGVVNDGGQANPEPPDWVESLPSWSQDHWRK